jgi:hypothetical protein
MLSMLFSLHPGLSFQKAKVKDALLLVYQAQKKEHPNSDRFSLTKSELEDWVETIQRRVRNLCRVVSQGMLKSPSAPWVRRLPWNRECDDTMNDKDTAKSTANDKGTAKGKGVKKGETGKPQDNVEIEPKAFEGEAATAIKAMKVLKAKQGGKDHVAKAGSPMCESDLAVSSSASSPSRRLRRKSADTSKQYDFGFLKEMMLPYRCKAGPTYKELGLPLELPSEAKLTDVVTAKWADGTEHLLDGITVADVKAVQGFGHAVFALAICKSSLMHLSVTVCSNPSHTLLVKLATATCSTQQRQPFSTPAHWGSWVASFCVLKLGCTRPYKFGLRMCGC